VGNLLSGLVRRALHWDPMIPSGGGSVVVMGLVGLCAVVGWRARTRLGDYLRNQMVWVLVLTAAIGLILPFFGLPIIDNWGHACGALVGAVIGLANGALTKQIGRPPAFWAGWAGSLVLAASAIAQVADDRAETAQLRLRVEQARIRWAEDERRLLRLEQVRELYRTVAAPRVIAVGALIGRVPVRRLPNPSRASTTKKAGASPPTPPAPDPDVLLYATVVNASLQAFDSMKAFLDDGATSADSARVHRLLAQSLTEPPTFEELREFNDRMAAIRNHVVRDLEEARSQAAGSLLGVRVEQKPARVRTAPRVTPPDR
jgi:hypothetical protein